MKMNKKGAVPYMAIVLVALVGVILWQAGVLDQATDKLEIVDEGPSESTDTADVQSCDGIASVNALYNDYDLYKAATDPGDTLTINRRDGGDYRKTVADDATSTSVPVRSSFSGVAGTNAGTPKAGYFSEKESFSTACSDVDIQTKLAPSGAPTITVVNSNGVTVNSDSNDESLGASATKTLTLKVVAASESCAAKHGALVVFEYDATYYSKFDSSDMGKGSETIRWGYNTTGNAQAATNDQREIFEFDGSLCDGEDVDLKFDVTTTSTQPTEDINVDVHWAAKDIDVDADTFETLESAIYDEDGNAIFESYTNTTVYAS